MKFLLAVVLILLIIGGINLGLIALAGFDLISAVFGTTPMLAKVINIAIGASGILALIFFRKYI